MEKTAEPVTLVRRSWPPVAFTALVAVLLCVTGFCRDQPWPIGLWEFALPAAFVLGGMCWPPNRFEIHRRYDGTRWSVPVALVLTIGLGIAQIGVAVGLFFSAFQHGLSMEGLIAAATVTCTAAAIVFFIMWLRDEPSRAVGLVRRDLRPALWAGVRLGLLFVGLDLIQYKLSEMLDYFQLPSTNVIGVVFETASASRAVIALVIGVVLVPFAEEVLFRGVLFTALRRTCGMPPAVLLSAAAFGSLHAERMFPTILGVLLAWLYHRTGTLWAPVTAHALVNLAGLGLGFDHGRLLHGLSWTQIGVLIALIGLVQLLGGRWPVHERCLCGRSGVGEVARCPDCLWPLAGWPAPVTVLLRVLLMIAGLSIGGGLVVFDQFAERPYSHGRRPEWLAFQYELLRGTQRPALATKLMRDWVADQPDAFPALLALSQEAYTLEDYPGIARLMEPVLHRTGPDAAANARVARNLLALAYAEIGGPHGQEGVRLARQAVEEATDDARQNIEDTLGWALLRVGQLEEAKLYLDRELSTYGLTTRAGVAELAYHRGVLLWATGEEEHARRVLEVAAQLTPPVLPYSRRAREILERGTLPEGLVPSLPPPLPEVPAPDGGRQSRDQGAR